MPYPVGTTTITWTATDAHSRSANCIQTVIVTDAKKPEITSPRISPCARIQRLCRSLSLPPAITSYQWYANNTNINSGGTLIDNATANTYTPAATTVGTTYYYVVVTGCNSSAFDVKALPTLASPLTPPPICNNAVFSYTPTSSLEGTTFTWSRDVVSGISNVAANGTGSISETLQNTSSSPVNVTYVYTLTNNGCSSAAPYQVIVTVNSAIQVHITAQTNVGCNGNSTGSVTVAASGGTTPYSYSIDGTDFSNTSGTFSSLKAGNYTITVKDNQGCTTTVPVTITEPAVLNGTITAQTNVDCSGNSTGSVKVSGSGGTTPYSYSINGTDFSNTSGTFVSLAARNYTVTIKDAHGCTATVPVTITEPLVLGGVVTTQTNVDCNGNSTGSVTIGGSGGTTPYSYSIEGTDFSNTSGTFGSLKAGNYTITVKDAHGCTATVPVTITQPDPVPAPVVSVTNNCGSTILATTASGTLLWSTGATTSSITVTTAGTYTVTQTVNGCTSPSGSGIAAPATPPSQPVVSVTNTCGFSKLSTMAAGALLWSTGATTFSITVNTAGTYTVTQTINGCTSAAGSGIAAPGKAPVITASNISVYAALKNCSASVSFGSNVTVTGTPAPNVIYKIGTRTITSPYAFPIGTTTVTVAATNSCACATKTFQVKVSDNQSPAITCKPDATKTVTGSTYTISGTEFNATATDNCCAPSLIYSLSGATVAAYSGSNTSLASKKLNVGITTITWKATDASGNVSTCSTKVTVKKSGSVCSTEKTLILLQNQVLLTMGLCRSLQYGLCLTHPIITLYYYKQPKR